MTKEKKKERKNPSETKKPKDTNDDDVILFNDDIKSKKIEKKKTTKLIFSLSLSLSFLVKPLTQTNNKLDEGLRNLTFKSEDKFKIKKKIEIIDESDEEERIQVN
jgi:hypothetical protein